MPSKYNRIKYRFFESAAEDLSSDSLQSAEILVH